jgi:hypothetical protein
MYSNIMKFLFTFLISLLVFFGVGYANAAPSVLEGQLKLNPDPILPGTPVYFTFEVQNIGSTPSPAGELTINYALIEHLQHPITSPLFTSEKQSLSSTEPGKKTSVTFTTPHRLPSVLDFVRDDWLLYEYQVVFTSKGKEHLLMTLPLTFSVHYYPVFKDQQTKIELES